MYHIQSHNLLQQLVGADAASKLSKERLAALRKSFAIGGGVVSILLATACQQFDGTTSIAPMAQPEAVVHAVADVHDNSWISQLHAAAAKIGSDGAVSDLSY